MARNWFSTAFITSVLVAAGIPGAAARGDEPATADWLAEPIQVHTSLASSISESSDWAADERCSPACDLWTRASLTNGFFGAQPALASHGIVYDGQLTQFYQGVAHGGREEAFEYGGKLDQFVIFKGKELGLNEGFEMVLHAESRFGQDVIFEAAGLAPVNVNLVYPSFENQTAITGLQITQAFSEEWAVTVGRINVLDFFNLLYPQTGRGVDGFMNTSVFLPLTVAKTVPLVFNGAGVLKLKDRKIQGAFVVADPQNIPTTSGLDNLLDNSASLIGLWRIFTNFGGQPGSHAFVGTWASGDFTSLDGNSWVILPPNGVVAGQETGTWSVQYIFEQQLWSDSCNPQRNLGLMTQWGAADSQTNPWAWVANASLQGTGLIRGRANDKMGIGWFYSGLSSDFQNLLSPPLDVQDLTGVEAYYNAQITPWFHLTADLQVVEPAERNRSNTAVVVGLRAKLHL